MTCRRGRGPAPYLYEFRGEMLPIKAIADALGVHPETARRRAIGRHIAEGDELADPYAEPRCTSIVVTIDGESRTVTEWAKAKGISRHTVYKRIEKGCDPALAIMLPVVSWATRRRNSIILRRIASTFRTSPTIAGGYAGTFANPLGTGVGRHVHHLQSGKTA